MTGQRHTDLLVEHSLHDHDSLKSNRPWGCRYTWRASLGRVLQPGEYTTYIGRTLIRHSSCDSSLVCTFERAMSIGPSAFPYPQVFGTCCEVLGYKGRQVMDQVHFSASTKLLEHSSLYLFCVIASKDPYLLGPVSFQLWFSSNPRSMLSRGSDRPHLLSDDYMDVQKYTAFRYVIHTECLAARATN